MGQNRCGSCCPEAVETFFGWTFRGPNLNASCMVCIVHSQAIGTLDSVNSFSLVNGARIHTILIRRSGQGKFNTRFCQISLYYRAEPRRTRYLRASAISWTAHARASCRLPFFLHDFEAFDVVKDNDMKCRHPLTWEKQSSTAIIRRS